jgi:Xaa-Pro aminopeptidase
MRDFGSSGVSFDTIVAFGQNSAIPHHETGDTILDVNQPILMDFGATFDGYASDITRTVFYGKPSEDFLSVYDAVLTANLMAEDRIVADITCKDADKIAREYLTDCGYGDKFTHSLGHGVGLRIHEEPTLSPNSNDIIKEGTVFTVEPGVYLNGKFGVRIEDTCYLTGGKTKRLFTDDKKLIVINDELL